MNVYKFEFRAIWKSLIFHVAIVIALYCFLIIGIYPMFAEDTSLLSDVVAYMPVEYLSILGLNPDNMFGYSGFYSFAYIYVALAAGIMATSISVSVFGREKKSHCQEFIFTKPVKRSVVFWDKFLAIMTAVFIYNAILIPISLYGFFNYDVLNFTAILATLSITLSQFVFVGVGIFCAVFIPKIRTEITITATVGVLAFIMAAYANSLGIEALYYLSPLHFFSPSFVFENGGYDVSLALYGLMIFVVSIGIPTMYVRKADLKD